MQRDLGPLGEDRTFDLLVIGGGIAGAVTAWDAAMRGLSVALVERNDFASGASGNNLRILHGGLRYLMRAELATARATVRERGTWLRIAPHLVEPFPVLVTARSRSLQNRVLMRALLSMNDVLHPGRNQGVDPDRHLPPACGLNRRQVLALAPDLESADLSGGVLFHDAHVYSSERLVLDVLRAAHEAGAIVTNHVETEAVRSRGGRIRGARVRDRLTGDGFEIQARALVNAAGAGASEVLRLMLGTAPAMPRYGAAFNLTVPDRGLRIAVAVNARSGVSRWSRGRQLLRVPWRDREMLGTGHVAANGEVERPEIAERAVAGLISEFNSASPGTGVRIEDVVLISSGLLPLRGEADRPDRLQRWHRVVDHTADGLTGAFTINTVKYTTARLAAEEAVDAVTGRLAVSTAPCRTGVTRLPAAPPDTFSSLRAEAKAKHAAHVSEAVLDHLLRAYGTDYEKVLEAGNPDPERFGQGAPVTEAEFAHGVRRGMACCADDLLRRRTELGARARITPELRALAESVLDAELGAGRWRPAPEPDWLPSSSGAAGAASRIP